MNMVLPLSLTEQGKDSLKIPNEQLTRLLLERKASEFTRSPNSGIYARIYNYPETRKMDWLLKRCIDIVGSLFGIIMLSPIFLLISIAIVLDSKGPILYSQERVGFRGKPFRMLKFRSMHTDAEARLQDLLDQNESNVLFKMKDDPRITRIGKFIRKTSLDEFPQLINVLKGEMSLVGPRPALQREVDLYKAWHHARLSTLPGMTGLWQVLGRSNITNFDQVVCMDVHYLETWNWLKDLNLIFRTIPAVLTAKGAA